MFAITLTEKGGDQRRLDFDKSEIKIGRVQGNDVVLPKGNVSKQHARIVLKDGKFIIVDLKSTNGTYVNGRKITSPLVVKDSDKIYIGDFILGILDQGAPAQSAPAMPASAPPAMAPPAMAPPAMAPSAPPPSAPPAMAPPAMAPPAMAPPAMDLSAPPAMAPPAMAPPAMAPPAMAPKPEMAPPRSSTVPPPLADPIGRPPQQPANRPSRTSQAPPATAPLATASPIASPMNMPRQPPASIAPPIAPPVADAKPRLVGAGARPLKHVGADKRFAVVPGLNAKAKELLKLQDSILRQLVPELGLDSLALERLGEEELWQRAESAIVDLVESMEAAGTIAKNVDQDQLIKETLNEALGLGPLEDLLADDTIDEIVVEGTDRILIKKSGTIASAGTGFSSSVVFLRVLQRLVAPTGVVIDDTSPFVDVRLLDGSRLCAALSPVSPRGPCLNLRKPAGGHSDLRGLQAKAVLSAQMNSFLNVCVSSRKNILVCGSPSSGKDSVLEALAAEVAVGERLITIEEVSHMNLNRDRWTALECRPGYDDVQSIGMTELIQGAIRMSPDRLVVADLKGGEAFGLIQAMNASCDGTLCSVAGEGSLDSLTNLSNLCSIGAGGHLEEVREMVALAIDVVVHVVRYGDGKVRVAAIDEVATTTEEGFRTLFQFDGSSHKATGLVPTFYEELKSRGFSADAGIFQK